MSGNTANTDKDPDRLRRARHETSHAICNVHYGIPFERVYIGKGGGRCRIALGRLGRVDAFRFIVCWLAGPAADRVFFDRDPNANSSDVQKAWGTAHF
jgi:hypothetical protein